MSARPLVTLFFAATFAAVIVCAPRPTPARPVTDPPLPIPKPILAGIEEQTPLPEPSFFKIATGSTAGTYFPVGEALAAIISHPMGAIRCLEAADRCGPTGMIAVAQNSDGSIRNVTAVSSGEMASALAQADLVNAAYTGMGDFAERGPLTNLRAIANLYPESIHVIAARSSGISAMADLAGSSVSVDQPGSGTRTNALMLLDAFGVASSSLELVSLDAFDAADLIRTGNLDVFFFVGGAPVPVVNELAVDGLISLVPLEGDAITTLTVEEPYFQPIVLADGTYDGIGQVTTLSVGALWIVNDAVSEDRVYNITRALWHEDNRDTLVSSHEQGQYIRLETALSGLPVPLHPGAERYYREAGLLEQAEAGPLEDEAPDNAAENALERPQETDDTTMSEDPAL